VSFAIGALVFLASILVTVLTTKEDPPEVLMSGVDVSMDKHSGVGEIVDFIRNMPKIMVKLGAVQFFSWFAFFTMWSFATPALTEAVFGAALPTEGVLDYEVQRRAYDTAANSVSSAMGLYGLSSMAFALLLSIWTSRRSIDRRWTHLISLALGGLGFLSMGWLSPANAHLLNGSFALIGVAWGSILSMPYAMLSGAMPAHGGWDGCLQHVHCHPPNRGCIGGHSLVERIDSRYRGYSNHGSCGHEPSCGCLSQSVHQGSRHGSSGLRRECANRQSWMF
jgi:maltose/moltooligosaccharide transporter